MAKPSKHSQDTTTNTKESHFLNHFAIAVVLVAFFGLGLVVIAHTFGDAFPNEQTRLDTHEEVAKRLAPVAGVYAGDTGRAAQAAAKAKAAKAAKSKVAYGGTTDGKEIFDHLCTNCHTAGVAGAPKVGDKADWGPRIAEGIDTLFEHAINGYTGPDGNHMPARGGNAALTDEQVKAAVKWIVSQAK